jgi:hypothetical protein
MAENIQSIARQVEKLEATRSSIVFWLTVLFIFFLVSIFGVFIIGSVFQINSITEIICSRLLQPVVEKALELVDGDEFEGLLESMDDNSDYYVETQRELAKIKAESYAHYLYTMAPENGDWNSWDFQYIIDGSFFLEEDAEDFSALGELEDVSSYDSAFFETIKDKKLSLGTVDLNETWGALISVYAPIINSNGEMVGLLGCDIDTGEIVSWVRSQLSWQIGMVFGLFLIGLAIYIFLVRKVNNSMKVRTGTEVLQ